MVPKFFFEMIQIPLIEKIGLMLEKIGFPLPLVRLINDEMTKAFEVLEVVTNYSQ